MRTVMLSGGLDSSVCLWWALNESDDPIRAVFVNYGQRSLNFERAAARFVADGEGIELIEVTTDAALIGGASRLIGGRAPDDSTFFVPGRNLALMALTLMAVPDTTEILFGGGHQAALFPDSTIPFGHTFENAASQAFGHRVRVTMPLVGMSKKQIGNLARRLNRGVQAEQFTYTCFTGVMNGCGECPACITRREAFA